MNTASPVLAAITAFSSGSRGARSRSPGVTFSSAAMNWDTAWATSMTKAHHHSDDAAAVRPSTSRGTISRQPDWWWPRCSWTMKLSPIQPRMITSIPDVTAHTAVQAAWTISWS